MGDADSTVNPDFAEWATLMSGCSGGNPDGAIWLSGIEWGGKDETAEFKKEIAELKGKVPSWTDEDVGSIFANRRKHQFDIRAFKLLGAVCNKELLDNAALEEFARRCVKYSPDSDFFRMNLYPLSFRNISNRQWVASRRDKTIGIPTKTEYMKWCREHRFPRIKSWIDGAGEAKTNPRLIIGVGSGCLHDFVAAFHGEPGPGRDDLIQTEVVGDRELHWLRIRNGRAMLCVVPFLNPYLLNTPARIVAMGRRIRELCDEQLTGDWLPARLKNFTPTPPDKPGA